MISRARGTTAEGAPPSEGGTTLQTAGSRKEGLSRSLIVFLVAILFHSFAVPFSMTALATSASMQVGDDSICPGDINLDGERGPGDLALLSAHISGEKILEGVALDNADVNFDFVVDVGDVVRLLEHNTGEFLLLPCGDFTPLEIACPGLSLNRTSAAPLEEVGLGILPEEFTEPVLAMVTEENNEIGIMTFVELSEDGSATLFTPFYPGTSLGGGNVKVQVTDGMVSCPLVDFSIEEIPSAPGESSRVADALQEVIRIQAAEFGLTLQDLMAGATELPRQAIPLAAAQRLLDHPDNPDSLRAMSEGTAPFFEGASDNALLDAFVAHLGVVGLVERGPKVTSALAQVTLPSDLPTCSDSAGNLDFCMKVAAFAEESLNKSDGPAVEQLKQDVALSIVVLKLFPFTRKLVKVTEETVSEIKKGFDKAFPVIGVALLIKKWSEEAAASLLPSSFSSLDLNLLPAVMEEDLEAGEWSALLIATSKGWKLDGRRVLQYAFKELGAKKLLKKQVKKGVGKLFELSGDLPYVDDEKAQEKLVGLIVKNVTKIAPDALKGVTLFELDPELFGPVEIHDEEWSESDVKGDAVEEFNHNQYKPVKVGTADIIVRVRTDGGTFGGVGSISDSKPVEVKPIILDVSPDQVIAKPGEKVTFTVTVENSSFPEKVKVTAVNGKADTVYAGGNRHTVTYTVPAKEKLPDVLTARHTAETGARRPPAEPRIDQAEIRGKASVIVWPDKNCVEPNEDTGIFHSVEGIKDQQVTWQTETIPSGATAGEVRNGRFFAPGSPAHVLITATSVANPEAKGAAIVKVGGCDCWWTVSVGGHHTIGVPGVDSGAFTLQPEGLLIGLSRVSPLQILEISAVDPAQLSFRVFGSLGLVAPDVGYASLEEIQGILFEVTDNIVEGWVDGMVTVASVTSEGPKERLTPFSVRFRISGEPSPLFPPSTKACVVQ